MLALLVSYRGHVALCAGLVAGLALSLSVAQARPFVDPPELSATTSVSTHDSVAAFLPERRAHLESARLYAAEAAGGF